MLRYYKCNVCGYAEMRREDAELMVCSKCRMGLMKLDELMEDKLRADAPCVNDRDDDYDKEEGEDYESDRATD